MDSSVEGFLAEARNVVVACTRSDGRPSLTPNWFTWDGEHFYVSTMARRAKAVLLRKQPRAQLLVDDSTGHRSVRVDVTAVVDGDVEARLGQFRAVREKYGRAVGSDDELLANLRAEERVLLVFTPEGPDAWMTIGFD
jgi:PPOX class probable F420-dependent enzyme